MKKYIVTIDIHRYIDDYKAVAEPKIIEVEAGNKRIASLRAMMELNKDKEYAGLYKTLKSVEEVK